MPTRLLTLVALLLAAGCTSVEERFEAAQVHHTPLELDPTDPDDLARWWSNGSILLRLDETGEYALYPGISRYDAPREQGSWERSRHSYVELSPYRARPAERVGIEVARRDGALVLLVDDAAPLRGSDAPPHVPEDDLLGTWRSSSTVLTIEPTGRYAFSIDTVRVRKPAQVVGHGGAWRLDGERLVLRPDAPNLGPYDLEVERADDRLRLRFDADVFDRSRDDA